MENLNAGRDRDPVLHWLDEHGQQAGDLEYGARFGLDKGPLVIHSNAKELIDLLNAQYVYYPASPLKPGSANETGINVYYAGNLERSGGIGHPIVEGEGRVISGLDRNQDGGFVHFQINRVECLWRPFDMLFTFSDEFKDPIRVLLCDPNGLGAHKKKLRLKACRGDDTPVFQAPHCDYSEVAELVNLLYIRRHGLFCIHAASLTLDGTGFLIVGKSGSGKSTAALALVRSGFTMLSDELTVIDSRDGSLTIGGILVPPRLAGGTPADLKLLEGTLNRQNTSKSIVSLPDRIVADSLHKQRAAKAIFFLDESMSDAERYSVSPIDSHYAFVTLMNQILDPTNMSRKALQADMLASLVNSCQPYRLTRGRRLDSLSDVIRECLKNG
jgi:hypothetical protein